MQLRPLSASELEAARRLLQRALEHDHVSKVTPEKLFGENGPRTGQVIGAFDQGALLGVVAMAGRWIKLLAVDPDRQRRGIGTSLLAGARASVRKAPAEKYEHEHEPRLRVMDHPGNYLSPGLDVRYVAAQAFFAHHGFKVTGEVENLRAPLDDNPLVTVARSSELATQARAAGYVIERAVSCDRQPLLDWVGKQFAAVWAFEVARALDGPRAAVHVALHEDVPVAFAAADGNNQGLGWFGPAGTALQHRGKGLGEALLIRCLLDVKDLPDGGVIAWIGPKNFYARACGAISDRRFLQMEQA